MLNFLKERISKKLVGWKRKFLSRAGKEILIKAVVDAIPMHVMSCFKLPKGWCEKINRMVANFWLGQQGTERKIHCVNWKKLSKPKGQGGLDFKDMQQFNQALLAKMAWRIIRQPDSLWATVLKGLYFPKTEFLEASVAPKASWLWKSISEGWNQLQKGLLWQVGDGGRI